MRVTARAGWRLAGSLAIVLWLAATVATPALAQRNPDTPEAAGPIASRSGAQPVVAQRHMVVAANPLAADAGLAMLRAGGNATDAAIATLLVLGLVEPQSAGLGGGAFLLHWDDAQRLLRTYDGRETAPAAATGDRFLRQGRPMPFAAAMRTGLAVGVPGAVRLLAEAHATHGRLAWSALFEPAIRLADDGFPVSPRLAALLASEATATFSPGARRYFLDASGAPWPAGHRLRNPAYAATLRRIAGGGAEAFYTGDIAQAIVAAVATAERHPGDMTLADLAGYRVKERPPLCFGYRARKVCSMGPPSSGGLAIGQALMLLEGFDLGSSPRSAMSPGAVHLMGEALRLAIADRNWWVGDSDFVPVPKGLLDPGYIAERRLLMRDDRSMRRAFPGLPPGRAQSAMGQDATDEMAGTTHLVVVDGGGNAVSMTATIEAGFGSGLWVNGFLLNNEMTDFSARPRDETGSPAANRIEGGKRPRSSMAPTLVFDDAGKLIIAAGSPGGGRIIAYVLKTLVALIDWRLSPQEAVDLANLATGTTETLDLEGPPLSVASLIHRREEAYRAITLGIGLAALGRTTRFSEMTSGTHVITRQPDGRLTGGADRRREGAVRGD